MKIPVRKGLRHLRGSLRSSRRPLGLLLAMAVSASVVASPPAPRDPKAPATTAGSHHWLQIGKASWYGRAFQGKRTATGERFDMNALTCAHRTLPLGSWLRVTNLRNRRSTFVRVNDRGPYESDTIVDLSYAAAQRVGLFGKAQVRVERVSPNDPELANALVAQLTSADNPLSSAR
ncbi:MAG TPA: septal ring lytic transglycosylase RlpA family protein [Acidobacteriaceae bacterium]|nr:septal ring lytic transglycosylase RlpA family protein [Acidobacteriaceae bacterium]